jgi:YHS domain-containing protein
MAVDPVCHMDVDPAKAPAKSDYKGQTYYFCAPGCKRAFDANPEKYLSPDNKGGMPGGHGH